MSRPVHIFTAQIVLIAVFRVLTFRSSMLLVGLRLVLTLKRRQVGNGMKWNLNI
jgi:hypothetical protein